MATTTTNPSIKSLASSINSFVKTFLSGESVSVETWTSSANQKQLRAVLSGKEQKKPKQVKVEKPKKSKSSYLFFCAEERPKIRQEQPELTSVQVTVLLGQRWKELKADKSRASLLSKYEKLASADNQRYATEKQASDKKKASQDQNKPKKEKSAYLLFCEKTRPLVKAEHPDMKAKDMIVELARRWQLQKQSK